MNRFAHDNLDPSITMTKRLMVMTKTIGPAKLRGRKPNGYDKIAGERLRKRLRAYDHMSAFAQVGYTRPGSMNRKKVG